MWLGKCLIKPAAAVSAPSTNAAKSHSPEKIISDSRLSVLKQPNTDFAEIVNAFVHDLIKCISNDIQAT